MSPVKNCRCRDTEYSFAHSALTKVCKLTVFIDSPHKQNIERMFVVSVYYTIIWYILQAILTIISIYLEHN